MKYATKASTECASNNSFKPRPLRGSAYALSCSTTPCRAAARLNSGVRPVQKQSERDGGVGTCITSINPLACEPGKGFGLQAAVARHKAATPSLVGTTSGLSLARRPHTSCRLERPALRLQDGPSQEHLSERIAGRTQANTNAGTGLTIRSSRTRFVASPACLRYACTHSLPLRVSA